MRDGGYRERQGIQLNDRISNAGGQLVVSLAILSFMRASTLPKAGVDCILLFSFNDNVAAFIGRVTGGT
ncbi:hypothetical protein V8C37DRAFT_377252 [Trichoderma ceciliae]